MRVFSAVLVSAALMAALPLGAATITVTGEGSVAAVPDMAMVSLGVTSQGKTAAEAMADNSAAMAAVISGLAKLGVAEKDIQTSALSLNPTWTDRSQPGTDPIDGFMASNMVTLRVQDIAGLGALLDATVGEGVNTLNGISFDVSAPGPLLDQARAAAVADAKARAEVLAAAAGVKLGSIETMTEGGGGYGGPMFKSMAADAVAVAAGQVTISASVTITYQIAD